MGQLQSSQTDLASARSKIVGAHTYPGRDRCSKPRLLLVSVKLVFDHFKWQILITLQSEDGSQSRNVVGVETAVTRSGTRGSDETFRFQETYFANGDVGEILFQHAEHFTDAQCVFGLRGH